MERHTGLLLVLLGALALAQAQASQAVLNRATPNSEWIASILFPLHACLHA